MKLCVLLLAIAATLAAVASAATPPTALGSVAASRAEGSPRCVLAVCLGGPKAAEAPAPVPE
jgi:hypothetical protein